MKRERRGHGLLRVTKFDESLVVSRGMILCVVSHRSLPVAARLAIVCTGRASLRQLGAIDE